MVCSGTVVQVYSHRDVASREDQLRKAQEQCSCVLDRLTVEQLIVDSELMTSKCELEKLRHHEFSSIFVLADVDKEGRSGADERTLAALVQLQQLNRTPSPDLQLKGFDPVVEMCEDST